MRCGRLQPCRLEKVNFNALKLTKLRHYKGAIFRFFYNYNNNDLYLVYNPYVSFSIILAFDIYSNNTPVISATFIVFIGCELSISCMELSGNVSSRFQINHIKGMIVTREYL